MKMWVSSFTSSGTASCVKSSSTVSTLGLSVPSSFWRLVPDGSIERLARCFPLELLGHVVNFLKLFKEIGRSQSNCSTSVHNCAVPHQATPRGSNRDVRSHRQRDPSSSMSRTLPHTAMIPSASTQYWYVQVRQLHYTIDRICPLHRWWPCSHSCLCSKSSWRMMMTTTCDDESPAVDNSSNS